MKGSKALESGLFIRNVGVVHLALLHVFDSGHFVTELRVTGKVFGYVEQSFTFGFRKDEIEHDSTDEADTSVEPAGSR